MGVGSFLGSCHRESIRERKPVGCGSPEIGFSPICDLLASPWLGMDVAGMRVLLGSSSAGP